MRGEWNFHRTWITMEKSFVKWVPARINQIGQSVAIIKELTNEHIEIWTKWPTHDDVIKWKHFPRYWPFVWGIHRLPVIFPHKGQWRGALMFSLIYARINAWVNNRGAGDLRRHCTHYGVIVMILPITCSSAFSWKIFLFKPHLSLFLPVYKKKSVLEQELAWCRQAIQTLYVILG